MALRLAQHGKALETAALAIYVRVYKATPNMVSLGLIVMPG